MERTPKRHGFGHGNCFYAFDDLDDLKRRLSLIPDPNFMPLYPGHKECPEAMTSGAISKAAMLLKMKPKELLKELTDAGMPRLLTKEEMIGRVSHMGATFLMYVRPSRDSHGSTGRIYEVRWPGATETDHDFVHNHEQTTQWYHEPGTQAAEDAVRDYLKRKAR